MDILGATLILSLLLIYFISVLGNSRRDKTKHLETFEKELSNHITQKQIELDNLKKEVDNRTRDDVTNLSNSVISILDIYKDSNIRIPVDILEELSYMNLHDNKDIFDYIENQRLYWKLENMKKPYKKVK